MKSAGRDHHLECGNGDVNAFLRLAMEPPLQQIPSAVLSNHQRLHCWLTTVRGRQWLNIGGDVPDSQQPKRFGWQSGVGLDLRLPSAARIAAWEIHRDGDKPDSNAAVDHRQFLGAATFILLLFSAAGGLLGPKILEPKERVSSRHCIEILIQECNAPNRSDSARVRDILESVVLDGQKLQSAIATMSGDARHNKVLGVLAVGQLKRKIATLIEDFESYAARLNKA